jgi:hypothetical protein
VIFDTEWNLFGNFTPVDWTLRSPPPGRFSRVIGLSKCGKSRSSRSRRQISLRTCVARLHRSEFLGFQGNEAWDGFIRIGGSQPTDSNLTPNTRSVATTPSGNYRWSHIDPERSTSSFSRVLVLPQFARRLWDPLEFHHRQLQEFSDLLSLRMFDFLAPFAKNRTLTCCHSSRRNFIVHPPWLLLSRRSILNHHLVLSWQVAERSQKNGWNDRTLCVQTDVK